MRLVGLTGGIATGKSTVARRLAERGFPIVDADVVAREVVAPGQPALDDIARRFPGVVRADGTLDRKALGARIFADPAERAALNAITHPRIREAVLARSLALAEAGVPLAIYDSPLLIENRLHEGLDGVILVVAPAEVQRERLMARDALGAAEADARIAAQLPLAEKRRFATWVIDNAGPLTATLAQVDHLAGTLNALASG
ncbi:MAG: dephospho-CoA kinase [Myxococcaceae bacterium]|nr:dephospho-CoA kinase [Myxococcaceae bacterium]MCA3011537.1 dephospho-CoA kinase [Myxococcaceae bacterium]